MYRFEYYIEDEKIYVRKNDNIVSELYPIRVTTYTELEEIIDDFCKSRNITLSDGDEMTFNLGMGKYK